MKLTLLEFIKEMSPKVGTWVTISTDSARKSKVLESEIARQVKVEKLDFENDFHAFQYVGIKDGKMCLVGEPISWKIVFWGKEGQENLVRVINEACKQLLGSTQVEIKAMEKREWTRLPANMQGGCYTLATEKVKTVFGLKHSGIYFVQNGNLYGSYLFAAYGNEYFFMSEGVRPIAFISVDNPKVLIETDERTDKKGYEIVIT